MNTMKHQLLTLAALACLSSTPQAQGIHAYVGAGAGAAYADTELKFMGVSVNTATSTGGAHFLAGLRFNPYIAVEAEYLSTGGFRHYDSSDLSVSGQGVSALFGAPVGHWNFFGKIGMASLTTKLTALPGYALIIKDTETKTGIVYGAGVQYAFTPHVALRLSWSSYEIAAGDGPIKGQMEYYAASGVFSF